jgi:glycosyltransferase involved in cell wall biosynthesis
MDSSSFIADPNNILLNILGRFKSSLVYLLASKILVESKVIAKQFPFKKKIRFFYLGLPKEQINLIKVLSSQFKMTKTILYAGRISKPKGLDRLVDAFISLKKTNQLSKEWKLKIVGRVEDNLYLNSIKEHVSKSDLDFKIIFEPEQSGVDYLQNILEASIIVNPSRQEGIPNVLADTYFAKRIYLTTTGTNVKGIIRNSQLISPNSTTGISTNLLEVVTNLDEYYQNWDNLYDHSKFKTTNNFFESLILS